MEGAAYVKRLRRAKEGLYMREITLEELLEAGCHFGHQVTRHNPKSRDFVFETRDNIHIIDLAKTKEGLEAAGFFVKNLAAKGGSLIVLGAKRQAQAIVAQEVKRAQAAGIPGGSGIFAVVNRWIGGTLTNFPEVSKNYKKLKDLTERINNPEEKAKYTKKEVGLWGKDRAKLETYYGGTADMKRIPDAVFIVDTHLEQLAVREAHAMHVQTVGIVDTNADPHVIDYPIPANDDATGSLQLIIAYIIDAWIEGKAESSKLKEQISKQEEKEITKVEKEEEKKVEPKKKSTKKVSEKAEVKEKKVKTKKSTVKK